MENIALGIIGMGKMGEAIVQGLKSSKNGLKFNVMGLVRSEEKAKKIAKNLAIPCTSDIKKIVDHSQILILAVKPHHAKDVLHQFSTHMNKNQLLISICAGLKISEIKKALKNETPLIRTMPNTPCLVGEGMTVLSPGPGVVSSHLQTANEIFQTIGKTLFLEESLMDGVTGLSGSGPAYTYLIIEALSDAGVKVGIPRKESRLLAAQTLLGAAKMVLSNEASHPAALKDEVTTPAGCTIDGLMVLEDRNVRSALINAVVASTERSKSLK